MEDHNFGKTSLQRLDGVHETVFAVAELGLKKSPVDFGIPEYGGNREFNTQRWLYETGKSKADGVINVSDHQLGLAFDIFAFIDGKASWDIRHLSLCACAVLEAGHDLGIRVKWGGHYKPYKIHKPDDILSGWDGGHFSIILPGVNDK